MEQFAKETLPVSLEAEMRHSYLDYAMSVIVGRALPDVRDGLKPVHRRVLFAMHEANIVFNRPYVKCARVVGDVMGKYHPHGDMAIYDTLVRMAQEFSLRYPLIDGQGNFGSVDGDNAGGDALHRVPAAEDRQRAHSPTSTRRPSISSRTTTARSRSRRCCRRGCPNLLVNGSSGIAVGMATNIPPHNLTEVVNACLALLANPEITHRRADRDHSGARIFRPRGSSTAPKACARAIAPGAGASSSARAPTSRTSTRASRQAIIVDEIPYQVNKANLLIRIGELVRDKKLEGISDLRDESDKSGMRVVIELKRGEVAEIVLNNLFKLTQLQDSFGMNMVALVDGQPRLLNLKQFLEFFLQHRREVVVRRTRYELRKARERGPHPGRSRRRAVERRRDHRAHQGRADAFRRQDRADGPRPGARRWSRTC